MAGAQIEQYQYGENTLTAFITVFNAALLGWFHLAIDTFFLTTKPTKINAGGSLELGGNVYHFVTYETITGATAAGVNYIRCGVSAGVMTAEFSQTAPAWDASKRGWYNGAYRYIVSFYNSATTYDNKKYLTGENNGTI